MRALRKCLEKINPPEVKPYLSGGLCPTPRADSPAHPTSHFLRGALAQAFQGGGRLRPLQESPINCPGPLPNPSAQDAATAALSQAFLGAPHSGRHNS